MKKNQRALLFSIYIVLYILFLFLAYTDRLPEFLDEFPDEISHAFIYGMFAALLHILIRRKKISFIPLAHLLVFLFSTGEEFIQKLVPDRTFNYADIVANLGGILFFLILDLIYVFLRKAEKDDSIFEDMRHFKLNLNDKIAVVFGATGLVGKELVELLAEDKHYKEIIVFNRRSQIYASPKITQIIATLDEIDHFTDKIKGNDLFCCLGTTIKKAGSRENFEFVDYVVPVKLARIASINGFNSFIAISSLGAERITKNFYLNTKGKMEKGIQQFDINNTVVMRPSILLGPRKEFRLGESIGKFIMKAITLLLVGKLKPYRPVSAKTVALAMIKAANYRNNKFHYDSEEIHLLARIKKSIDS